jgi:Fur family transcriptional regulator, iron response regulator
MAQSSPSNSDIPCKTSRPWEHLRARLRQVGLRSTRQRMAIGHILFSKSHRHVTAEMIHAEATQAKIRVSLATIYNTLHLFTEAGLLRQIAVDASKAHFDTNNSDHHHFFIESHNKLIDISGADMVVDRTPNPPEGYEIARIDVLVRLRPK